jgi:pimeloyl-ACP methyl ester carboxylesterase
MATAKIRGLNINYEVVGEDGPWVTLITGGRRGYREFIPLAQKIAAQGFRVLLHDRRNTGASDILIASDEVEEITWADDLALLLDRLGAKPAFIGGSSAGARTAMLFCIRHPDYTRALLLLRVTGGAFAANRLPENYYGQFIRIAKEGGMAAIMATPEYQERIRENPANEARLRAMDVNEYIAHMEKLLELFLAGGHLPVMNVTDEQLATIKAPTLIIPGNDNTHASQSAQDCQQRIKGSRIHRLPVEDEDRPLIPFEEWEVHEPEIARVFADFMREVEAG